ncbi:reverse transcriptase domain-containing protein [Tanacetum coccineum]|uniref:Reverse transcriptase domain-containing protein n=1 Tax=Tanacetum coccineum TaxID=301880 RepID=A0ABQ4X2I5_9ASTR
MYPLFVEQYINLVSSQLGVNKIKNLQAGEYCKIRIPIAMWPCKVEEKMTLKEVDGQTVRKSKQVIARMHYQPEFLEISGYETRKYNCGKGGIYNYGGQHNYTCATTQVDLQVGFQWIIVDALHKMAPSRRSGNNENPDIAAIIVQQLQTILPQIVTQVTNNVNNANNGNGGNGGGGNGNGGNNECTFKAFQSCNSKEYDGKGGAIMLTRWIEKMENVIDNSGCAENQKVRYAASSLVNKALNWWNTQVQARGRMAAMAMAWNDFKALMVQEFCPSNEMEKLENEFWNHKMVRANHAAYTDRFHELAKLVPNLVTPELSLIKRARILTDEAVSCGTLTKGSDNRKGVEESSKTRGSGKDNKKAKVGTGFVETDSPRNETVGYYPRQVAPVNAVRMSNNL